MSNEFMYYQVGNQIFSNKFQAAHYAGVNNTNMRFNLYDSVFDKTDWSQEPSTSWDTLLDIRAQQIAAKKKPIVFYFSGGTDSYTIYKVFERNNIHIDVVYMRQWGPNIPHEFQAQVPVIDLMRNSFYDKHTKIIIQDPEDMFANKAYTDPDWIWNQGIRHQFGVIGADLNSNNELSDALGTDDFISVIGFEKPRLHFTNGGVYSYQDDENYVRPMSDPRFDCFYISPDLPELHVKQSYMLLKYVRSLHPMSTSPEQFAHYNDVLHNAAKFHWHNYSIDGCGRFGDMNQSHIAHIGNVNCRLYLPSDGKFTGKEYSGRQQKDFIKFENERAVKNYLDGVMRVVTDPAGKYLMTDPNNFYSIRQFRSKYYRLTF